LIKSSLNKLIFDIALCNMGGYIKNIVMEKTIFLD